MPEPLENLELDPVDPVDPVDPKPIPGKKPLSLEETLSELKRQEAQAVASSHLALQEAIKEVRQVVEQAQTGLSSISDMKNEISATLTRIQAQEAELNQKATPVDPQEIPPVVPPVVPQGRTKPKRPRWL